MGSVPGAGARAAAVRRNPKLRTDNPSLVSRLQTRFWKFVRAWANVFGKLDGALDAKDQTVKSTPWSGSIRLCGTLPQRCAVFSLKSPTGRPTSKFQPPRTPALWSKRPLRQRKDIKNNKDVSNGMRICQLLSFRQVCGRTTFAADERREQGRPKNNERPAGHAEVPTRTASKLAKWHPPNFGNVSKPPNN